MMGEHISDEEVDMIISMLDLNGNGQVSFKVRYSMEIKTIVQWDILTEAN